MVFLPCLSGISMYYLSKNVCIADNLGKQRYSPLQARGQYNDDNVTLRVNVGQVCLWPPS